MSQKKVDHAGDWTKPGPSVWQSEMLSTAWKLGKMSCYPREWPFPPARYLSVRIVERSPMAMALRAQAEKWRTRHIFVFTNGLHAEWTIGLWCKRCPLHYKNGTHLRVEELRSSYFLEKEIFSVQTFIRVGRDLWQDKIQFQIGMKASDVVFMILTPFSILDIVVGLLLLFHFILGNELECLAAFKFV